MLVIITQVCVTNIVTAFCNPEPEEPKTGPRLSLHKDRAIA